MRAPSLAFLSAGACFLILAEHARPTAGQPLLPRQDSVCSLSTQPPNEGLGIEDVFSSFALFAQPQDQACLDACYGFAGAYMVLHRIPYPVVTVTDALQHRTRPISILLASS